MFALLEVEQTARARFLDRFRKQNSCIFEEKRDPAYLKATLQFPANAKEPELERRTSSTVSALSENGIIGVVLPREFKYAGLFEDAGMAIATPVPLYRRMAGRMAEKVIQQGNLPPKNVKVAIIGRHVTNEIERCVAYLQACTRSLMIAVGEDTSAFCYGVQKMLGMSVQSFRGQRADVYILFSVPRQALCVPDKSIAINVSGGVPVLRGGMVADGAYMRPPKRLAKKWPPDCDTPAFLSALAGSGAVRTDEIEIEALSCRGKLII